MADPISVLRRPDRPLGPDPAFRADLARMAAQELGEPVQQLEPAPRPPSLGRNVMIAVLAAVVVVLIALPLFFLDNEEPANTTTPTTIPTTSTVASSTIPLPILTEVWAYESNRIGIDYRDTAHGFTHNGQTVAVVDDEGAGLTGLDIASGSESWHLDLPEDEVRILRSTSRELLWATPNHLGKVEWDGTPVWETALTGPLGFVPPRKPAFAVDEGGQVLVVFEFAADGNYLPPVVARFDRSGGVVWSTELSGAGDFEDMQWAEPVIVDGGLILQTMAAVYRLDLETGTQEWRKAFIDPAVNSWVYTSIAQLDGVVYVADPAGSVTNLENSEQIGGEVLGLDAVSGMGRLRIEPGGAARIVGMIGSRLIYSDGRVVSGPEVVAGDTWSAPAGAAVTIANDRIYYANPDAVGTISVTGEILSEVVSATRMFPTGSIHLPPAIVGGTMFLPGWQGPLAIDMETGEVLRHWPAGFFAPALAIDDERALVGVAAEGIYIVSVSRP